MNFILLIGGSFSALTFGGTSPGHLLAERWQVPTAIYAHAGKSLSEVMPPDKLIREAGLVVAPDPMYWAANKWPCDEEGNALEHLFNVRDGRPMIMATIPEGEGWTKGRCTDRFNAVLRQRCKALCMLIELSGENLPPGLHPDREWVEQMVRKWIP